MEKKCKKSKMAAWGGLTNSCEKRSQKQRRKGKIYPFEYRVPKNSKRDKKAFLSDQCKEIEENNRIERLEISSRKLEIPREHLILCVFYHNKKKKKRKEKISWPEGRRLRTLFWQLE